MDKEIYEKVIQKKEFSNLPRRDVELAFSKFEKRETSDEDKIKLTRDLLRKVFSAFTSQKLLNPKDKDPEWILKKHISTRERLGHYEELYERLLVDFGAPTVLDLGAGVNGFSYGFFKKGTHYVGVEAVGQLVDLQNNYFKKEKIKNAKVIHESLFGLEKIKKIIRQTDKPRVVFLFKALDSLEMVERDYSKKLLREIVPLADRVIVSFATKSLVARKSFKVKRYWFENFVKEEFNLIEDFELGSERYVVIEKK